MQAAARPNTLVDAVIPTAWTQSRAGRIAIDVILMLGFAGFVAVCAQFAVQLPWTTVPITGQTFGALVSGGALGARRGAGALVIYMLLGMASIPVFAPGSFGLTGNWDVHFVLPWKGTSALPWDISSGGYIVGFILTAFLTGLFAQRAWDRKPWNIAVMFLGAAVLYIPGLLWLHYLITSGWVHPQAHKPLADLISGGGAWDKTLKGGLYPFIVGDLMKLYLAALTLPIAWALVNRVKGVSDGGGKASNKGKAATKAKPPPPAKRGR